MRPFRKPPHVLEWGQGGKQSAKIFYGFKLFFWMQKQHSIIFANVIFRPKVFWSSAVQDILEHHTSSPFPTEVPRVAGSPGDPESQLRKAQDQRFKANG